MRYMRPEGMSQEAYMEWQVSRPFIPLKGLNRESSPQSSPSTAPDGAGARKLKAAGQPDDCQAITGYGDDAGNALADMLDHLEGKHWDSVVTPQYDLFKRGFAFAVGMLVQRELEGKPTDFRSFMAGAGYTTTDFPPGSVDEKDRELILQAWTS